MGAKRLSLSANRLAFGGCLIALLASCGPREILLPGERVDLRALDRAVESAVDAAVNQTRPIDPGPPVVSANWTHLNGSPQHTIRHPALSQSLTPVWAQPIGAGNDRKHRITADPVVSAGRVFTLDSRARVSAHATTGAALWSVDLTPPADNADDASGGGLAVAGDTLYVTTGFGELTALDVATGGERWRQDFDSAVTGAPTAVDGVVYVVTRNQVGWAIDATNGRVLWQILGAPSESGIAGGPAPATVESLVVFPFGSAQLIGAVRSAGTTAWQSSVAGGRAGAAYSRISDLTGDPVVIGTTVYAGNHAGRASAFDARTGQTLWTAEEGALGPLWAAGGSLFFVSDQNRLIRMDAATGEVVWAVDLAYYQRIRLSRRETIYAHFGPVLAGGRLLVASDDGILRSYDPRSGALISATEIGDGAATNPVIAGGVLYLVTEDGRLRAYR